MTPELEKQCQVEAQCLAQLPRAEQRAVIAWHRDIAANPKVRKADRNLARERADAIEQLLFPTKKNKH
jgi:hypothetical protein